MINLQEPQSRQRFPGTSKMILLSKWLQAWVSKSTRTAQHVQVLWLLLQAVPPLPWVTELKRLAMSTCRVRPYH